MRLFSSDPNEIRCGIYEHFNSKLRIVKMETSLVEETKANAITWYVKNEIMYAERIEFNE